MGEKKSFLEHLLEMRARMVVIVVAVILSTGVCFFFYKEIDHVLTHPLTMANRRLKPDGLGVRLIILDPLGGFRFVVRMGLIAGLMLASPLILQQIWAFVAPGLYPREKRAVAPIFWFGLFFFLGGAAVAYFFACPVALEWLVRLNWKLTPTAAWGGVPGTDPGLMSLPYYVTFVVGVLVAFGIAFEMPLVVMALSAMGLVTPAWLVGKFRYAIVGAFVLGALLTPPEILTQVVLAFCLIGLYFLSIALSWLSWRRRKAEEIEQPP